MLTKPKPVAEMTPEMMDKFDYMDCRPLVQKTIIGGSPLVDKLLAEREADLRSPKAAPRSDVPSSS